MKIRNVSPQGDLFLPVLNRDVKAGEVFDIPDIDGAPLLEQPDVWAAVKESTKEEAV